MPEWTPWFIYGLAAVTLLSVVAAAILLRGGGG